MGLARRVSRFGLTSAVIGIAALALVGGVALAGNVVYETDPITGRLTRATFEDGSYMSYSYDLNGNRTGAVLTLAADVVAPSAPTGLSASVFSGTQINLSWTAATDNVGVTSYAVERCQGSGCNNFTEVAQPAGTSHPDTGRTPATAYTYRVRARDAAGNTSAPSNVVGAATPDSLPPSAPGTPVISNISANGATVSYQAASDNVAVTAYEYSLNGGSSWNSVGNVVTFPLASLTSWTNYTVMVRARDGANLAGSPASSPQFTTLDNLPPSTPTGLNAAPFSSTQINLTWNASTDNRGVAGYRVERCQGSGCGSFTEVGQPPSNSYSDPGRTPGALYSYRVRAVDQTGLFSPGYSNISTTNTGDTSPPSTPPNLQINSITGTSAVASWGVSTDNVGVTGYEYSLAGGAWTLATSPLTLGGLTNGTTYSFQVRARDGAGLTSPPSSTSFQTIDTTAPTSPPNLQIGSITATSAVASWGVSSDNVGVTGYEYSFNGGAWTAGSSPRTLTGLTNGTTYSFQVRARDAANLTSAPSSTSFQTTDTTAPSAPSNLLIGSITATTAVATWTAATDNVGVTSHEYSLNGGSWTTATSGVTLGGLTNGTSYSFQVRARDAAGLAGSPISTSFQTVDTTAPTATPNLAISSITATSAVATWGASSDNVGVTGYEYSLAGGSWTAASSGLTLGGLTNGTTYSFQVRARDGAGLASSPSVTSFMTIDTTPPGTPPNVAVDSITGTTAVASWSASSDNVGVTAYEYTVNGSFSSSTTSTSVSLGGLTNGTSYTFQVRARDAANLTSTPGTRAFTTVDTTPPGTPGTPTISSISSNSAVASWGAASDNVGVTGYEYSINGGGSWAAATSGMTVTGLSPNVTYTFQVRARDAAGLTSVTPASSAPFTTPSAITIASRSVSTFNSGVPSQASYGLNSAGDIITSAPIGFGTQDTGDWLVPKAGMANFQVRRSAGNCLGPAIGQWIPLSTSPAWVIVYGSSAPGSANCSMTIEISAIANPSVILGTAGITLTASH